VRNVRHGGLRRVEFFPVANLVLLASAVFPLSASGQAAPAAPAQADPIAAYLQPLVASHTLAGAVTLVAGRDSVLYLKSAGYRDLAAGAPMPTNAMFWIASTSKPITVTAFMMLVDEGKVHLDDPVEKYLPEFRGLMVRPKQDASAPASSTVAKSDQLVPADHPIRVREILSHTSGLPFKSAAQPGALDLLTLKDSVRSFASEPLLFQPGTDYSYSNEGIDTAARIIEVVTGTPYEQFLQERLFDPLGMKDTTFWPNAEQIARLATSYKPDPQTGGLVAVPIEQLTYPLDDRQHRFPMPAGGIFSTASDVAKFCQMILNGGVANGRRFISAESLREMTTPQNGKTNKAPYGLGMGISDVGFGHGGAYKNAMEINIKAGRIFIFMVQQAGPWGTKEGDGMISALEKIAWTLPASEPAASH
jgi:CubicO group peptidase (beta-lactamase class C family)